MVTEALASGLIVLAYNYAAPEEYIQNAVNGFLAPYDDEPAYMKQLAQALAAQPDWPAIRQAARKTAESLDWSTVVQNFAQELQEVREESLNKAAQSDSGSSLQATN